MTMEDGIAEFGFDCKVRKLSVRTIANYQKQMRYLQRYLKEEFEVTTVEDVKSYHLKQFLAMMDDRGRKPRYINDLLKVFKTFFNYCKREGHIKQSPAANVKNMKQPKVKILTFSEEEIRKLLNYFNKRDYLSIRNRTILAMFFDTGIRLTELMTMKEEQLHDEFILIHGKGAKERVVPISPYLSKALMRGALMNWKARDTLPSMRNTPRCGLTLPLSSGRSPNSLRNTPKRPPHADLP